MAMGRRRTGREEELFVAASEIHARGNPFYRALSRVFEEQDLDDFAEETCREFYAEKAPRASTGSTTAPWPDSSTPLRRPGSPGTSTSASRPSPIRRC